VYDDDVSGVLVDPIFAQASPAADLGDPFGCAPVRSYDEWVDFRPHSKQWGNPTITSDEVRHIAMLARLALTDDEIDAFAGQLTAVLEHANDVAALDTSGVPATAHPLPLVNVLRDDVARPCLDRDEVLAAAPAAEAGRFRVPRILGDAP